MALTGREPAEIFFSAKFSLPRKKLPYPAVIFDGQLKTRNAPGTSFEPYPIPVLADPKKIIRALDGLRSLKSFPSAAGVNTTTGPQLPKYVSNSFGSLDQPWEILSKVVYRDGRILVGTAGKQLDNQRAEIVRFIIPAKPGRSLSLFPPLITPLPLRANVR